MAQDDARFSSEDLRRFTAEVFTHVGLTREDAEVEAATNTKKE